MMIIKRVAKTIAILVLFMLVVGCSDQEECTSVTEKIVHSSSNDVGSTATIKVNQQGVYTFYDMATNNYVSEVVNTEKYNWNEYEVLLSDSVYCIFEEMDSGEKFYSEINPVVFEDANHYTVGEWKVFKSSEMVY